MTSKYAAKVYWIYRIFNILNEFFKVKFRFLICCLMVFFDKGQLDSEWIYEVNSQNANQKLPLPLINFQGRNP